MRFFLQVCAVMAMFVAGNGTTPAPTQKYVLLRDPSITRTQIAFTYAGSIWVAGRDGSNVRRLTNGGHESRPIFSPDGSQIAFTGVTTATAVCM